MAILTTILLLFFVHKVASASCPDGWVGHGTSCYHFSHDKENWYSALGLCKFLGGHLAEMNDAAEARYLNSQVALIGAAFWLGAEDLQEEGNWVWATSKTALSSGYTEWHPGEPNNVGKDENCLITAPEGLWYDGACTSVYRYICEKDSQSSEVIG